MRFKELFEDFSKEKKNNTSRKINKDDEYYKIIMKKMPNDLNYFNNNNEIRISSSVGKGYYSDIPWICLLSENTAISPSAQKGIYIVLLFSKDGESFFLALGQGITNFKKMGLKSKEMEKYIQNTVKYFQQEIPSDMFDKYGFSKEVINLGDRISTLAKGYEKTTIISRKFSVSDFNDDDFSSSLARLIKEYKEIIDHIGVKTYDEVIELINPQDNIKNVDEALEEITCVLKKEFVEIRDLKESPIKVERGTLKENKYNKISQNKINKKIDYFVQAKENYQIGLKGEKLVLEIERKRVSEMGYEPDKYVRWVANESDSYGYDIESLDYINGKPAKIFIEVKTTKSFNDTPFYVSKNEVEISKEKKDLYRVYRIFDLTSHTPKYYIAKGVIEDNFQIDPTTFSATYRYNVEVQN